MRIKKDLAVLLVIVVAILAVAAYLGSVGGEHNEHFIGDCPTYNGCRPYIPAIPLRMDMLWQYFGEASHLWI